MKSRSLLACSIGHDASWLLVDLGEKKICGNRSWRLLQAGTTPFLVGNLIPCTLYEIQHPKYQISCLIEENMQKNSMRG